MPHTIGTCPARATDSSLLCGAMLSRQQVVNRSPPSEMSRSLAQASTVPGSVVTLASALRLARASPMKAAASTPCPCTSPMVIPATPSRIGNAS